MRNGPAAWVLVAARVDQALAAEAMMAGVPQITARLVFTAASLHPAAQQQRTGHGCNV